MGTLDSAGEFLRITERYRQMSDGELLVLIPQSSQLTPLAQQALASEVRTRGLKVEEEAAGEKPSDQATVKPPAFVLREPAQSRDSYGYDSSVSGDDSPGGESADGADSDETDSYEEDRKLVELCTVWSERDALQLQSLLDTAAIPFFMGPEKATGVDKVTSSFANGVSVQIMKVGLPWAAPAMQHYEPADDPTPKEVEGPEELVVRCPQCHSAEVVFEGGTSTLVVTTDDSSQKYRWRCDSCGNQWEDDGVAEEG